MPTEEQIKELAYQLWEQEGRPDGKDWEHYFKAKRILEEREAAAAREAAQAAPAPVSAPTPIPPSPGIVVPSVPKRSPRGGRGKGQPRK